MFELLAFILKNLAKRFIAIALIVALVPLAFAGFNKWRDARSAATLEASAPLVAGLVGNPGGRSRTTDGYCRSGRDGSRYVGASKIFDERVHTAAPPGTAATTLAALLAKQGFAATRDIGDGISRMYLTRRFGALGIDEEFWAVMWTADKEGRIATLQGCAGSSYYGP